MDALKHYSVLSDTHPEVISNSICTSCHTAKNDQTSHKLYKIIHSQKTVKSQHQPEKVNDTHKNVYNSEATDASYCQ